MARLRAVVSDDCSRRAAHLRCDTSHSDRSRLIKMRSSIALPRRWTPQEMIRLQPSSSWSSPPPWDLLINRSTTDVDDATRGRQNIEPRAWSHSHDPSLTWLRAPKTPAQKQQKQKLAKIGLVFLLRS
jgi:hypothetical protein